MYRLDCRTAKLVKLNFTLRALTDAAKRLSSERPVLVRSHRCVIIEHEIMLARSRAFIASLTPKPLRKYGHCTFSGSLVKF